MLLFSQDLRHGGLLQIDAFNDHPEVGHNLALMASGGQIDVWNEEKIAWFGGEISARRNDKVRVSYHDRHSPCQKTIYINSTMLRCKPVLDELIPKGVSAFTDDAGNDMMDYMRVAKYVLSELPHLTDLPIIHGNVLSSETQELVRQCRVIAYERCRYHITAKGHKRVHHSTCPADVLRMERGTELYMRGDSLVWIDIANEVNPDEMCRAITSLSKKFRSHYTHFILTCDAPIEDASGKIAGCCAQGSRMMWYWREYGHLGIGEIESERVLDGLSTIADSCDSIAPGEWNEMIEALPVILAGDAERLQVLWSVKKHRGEEQHIALRAMLRNLTPAQHRALASFMDSYFDALKEILTSSSEDETSATRVRRNTARRSI